MIAETQRYQLTAADLEVLLALTRGGNLAEAARRLSANASTVFRSVQRLEKELGQSLFTRSRAGYQATEVTQSVVAHAERIEAELEAARGAALATQDEVSGRVRVTTTDSMLYNLVIPVLAGLAREHPGLQLDLVATHEVASLTKRDADIALRATMKPPEHLVGHRIGQAKFAVYGAKSLVGKKPKPLDQYDWAAVDESLPEHPGNKWRRKHFPKVTPRYELDSLVAMGYAVRAGLAVGVLSTYRAKDDPGLVALTGEIEPGAVDIWVLTHPESRHLRRIAAVYNYFAKNIHL